MVADPRKLRPSELCRLLNSTPLGEVINERQLHRHRSRAGMRIGDARHIDLLRYIAWLVQQKHEPKPESSGDSYEAMKERARARNAELAKAGRDIGELPEVKDPERKARASTDFRYFCESYFPLTFHMQWSDDHLKVISKIEQAVLRGGLFSMAMPRGSGKALALDTPIPTPSGWTTMGEVKVGDWVYDQNGSPCRVVYCSPVFLNRKCFRVDFSDGESIVCDSEHLWQVNDRWARKNPKLRTTAEIASNYRLPSKRGRNEFRYSIELTDPIHATESDLCIDPYLLGYWLGDGTSANSNFTVHRNDVASLKSQAQRAGELFSVRNRASDTFTCLIGRGHGANPEHERKMRLAIDALDCRLPVQTAQNVSGTTLKTVQAIKSLNRWDSIRRGEKSSLQTRLGYLDLLNNKHIPKLYLRGSIVQRLALLQGIMDADGHISSSGNVEITLKANRLAEDFGELLSTLGIKWNRTEKQVKINGKLCGPFLRFNFSSYKDLPCFRMPRKYDRLRERPRVNPARKRFIVSVVEETSEPVRCIQVDSPSHLYLAGRKMVPTHNTTVCECACIWAVLNGHREFVCLIGSDEGHAMDMLESIKMELDGNDLLLEDYPEVLYPIQCLDGIANRCNGQLHQGRRTHISWTAREIVLPTVPGSVASGAIIKVAGITGRIRGMKYKRSDGQTVRPSLVVIDDPQTDESARSVSQCATRESILAGAILGLAGPGKKISGIMPCTVIRPSDMADNILSRDKHPEWNGERTKMVYSFPDDEKLWQRYSEVRAASLRDHGDLSQATQFYIDNREAMDSGAVIAWPQRFNHDEASAVQHAMNLKLQDEAAFFAEYQNEPLPEVTGLEDELTAEEIAGKLNRMKRGELPIATTHLTMFIDVQQNLLFYVVAAWGDDFTGFVVDYGAFPDQKRPYFTLRDARFTLGMAVENTGLEGSIYAGLERLTGDYLAREWLRDDGAMMRIERCLIDANWGSSTDVVYQFCRQSPHAGIVLPSHGRFVGASSQPFSEYKRRPGDRIGHNWRMPNVRGKRAIRHVLFDTNYWKSFIQARFRVAMGDPGCLSLFGTTPDQHRLFAEHLTAEYRVKTEGRGRTVDEWKLRPERSDNHWLDCLVGAAVGASMEGVSLDGTGSQVSLKRNQRVSFQELQRKKRN